jgi:hypothetical protein
LARWAGFAPRAVARSADLWVVARLPAQLEPSTHIRVLVRRGAPCRTSYEIKPGAAILRIMNRKSASTVKRSEAELRRMAKRGEIKSDWKAAAKKPLPSGRDPDDAMEEIDSGTTKLPKSRRS